MNDQVKHAFVEFIPDQLEGATLYISLTYNITTHLCFCGCGSVVNASLSPSRWSIEYDGERVTMYPSFGNFSFPCQSHYWIRRSRVVWAKRYTTEEIAEARQTDAQDSAKRYHAPSPGRRKKAAKGPPTLGGGFP
ncbi:MAG: DUF6527 family protein [Thermoplasmatota archaeon]